MAKPDGAGMSGRIIIRPMSERQGQFVLAYEDGSIVAEQTRSELISEVDSWPIFRVDFYVSNDDADFGLRIVTKESGSPQHLGAAMKAFADLSPANRKRFVAALAEQLEASR